MGAIENKQLCFDNSFFRKNSPIKLNFSDICVMNAQWQGLLGYLKFLIKRNPE